MVADDFPRAQGARSSNGAAVAPETASAVTGVRRATDGRSSAPAAARQRLGVDNQGVWPLGGVGQRESVGRDDARWDVEASRRA